MHCLGSAFFSVREEKACGLDTAHSLCYSYFKFE